MAHPISLTLEKYEEILLFFVLGDQIGIKKIYIKFDNKMYQVEIMNLSELLPSTINSDIILINRDHNYVNYKVCDKAENQQGLFNFIDMRINLCPSRIIDDEILLQENLESYDDEIFYGYE